MSEKNNNKLLYRPEIDGLRALSVLLVILFHLKFSLFKGGFIGVDIFFVISGYLISSIILKEINQESFNLRNFYLRRIRRILPLLLTVIFFSSIFSFFFLLPFELIDFSISAISSIFFVSNFYFWQYSGYFSPNADTLPLLHTWSLSIEEQYYFFYPLLLVFFLKKNNYQKLILFILFLLIVSSLLFSQFSGNLKINFPFYEKNFLFFNQSSFASFYLPFGRIWELLLGYFLCIFYPKTTQVNNINKNIFSFLGISILIFSLFLLDKNSPHPGLVTLIPVIGISLFILYCDSSTILYKLFANRFIVFIGLISFSLYLWHLPIFVFLNISKDNIFLLDYIIYFISLFLISFVSWRYLEKPMRNQKIISNKNLFLYLTFLYLIIISIFMLITSSKGFINTYSETDKNLLSKSNVQHSNYVVKLFNKYKKNKYQENKINILIIGDSQAQDLTNILSHYPNSEMLNFKTIYISSKCQIYYPKDHNILNKNIKINNRSLCINENNLLDVQKHINKFNIIFLASSWLEWSVDLLEDTIHKMNLSDEQKLYIVGPKDFGHVKLISYLNKTDDEKINLKHFPDNKILNLNNKLSSIKKDFTYIDFFKSICPENYCPKFDNKANLISFDGGHLTASGSEYIYDKLKQQLKLTNE